MVALTGRPDPTVGECFTEYSALTRKLTWLPVLMLTAGARSLLGSGTPPGDPGTNLASIY